MITTGIFTEYCCRLILAEDWEKTARVLDKAIKSDSYEKGVTYIDSMNVSEEKKSRLRKCLLSYKGSC